MMHTCRDFGAGIELDDVADTYVYNRYLHHALRSPHRDTGIILLGLKVTKLQLFNIIVDGRDSRDQYNNDNNNNSIDKIDNAGFFMV